MLPLLKIVIGNVLDIGPFIQESLWHSLLASLTQVCDLSLTWVTHIAEVSEFDHYSEVVVEDLITFLHQGFRAHFCFPKVKDVVCYEGSVELNSANVTLAEHFALLLELDPIITEQRVFLK